MALVLYECPPTRSTRDRWVLQELGVPFDSVVVNLATGEHRGPAFLGVNPAGKLPALVDDGQVVTESAAIAVYLAEKYREKGFMPQGARPRAQVLRWLFFTVTELEQPLWRMAKHRRIYAEPLRLPAEIELASRIFRRVLLFLTSTCESASLSPATGSLSPTSCWRTRWTGRMRRACSSNFQGSLGTWSGCMPGRARHLAFGTPGS